jgi:hypothetical protein
LVDARGGESHGHPPGRGGVKLSGDRRVISVREVEKLTGISGARPAGARKCGGKLTAGSGWFLFLLERFGGIMSRRKLQASEGFPILPGVFPLMAWKGQGMALER